MRLKKPWYASEFADIKNRRNNKHKQVAINCIKRELSIAQDNASRANRAFSSMPEAQLSETYGYSGKTHKEVLADYTDVYDRMKACLTWLEGV